MRRPLIKYDKKEQVLADPQRLYLAWSAWRKQRKGTKSKLLKSDWNTGFAAHVARRLGETWRHPSELKETIGIPVSRSDLYRLGKEHTALQLRREVAIQIMFLTRSEADGFDGDVTHNGSLSVGELNSSDLVSLGRCSMTNIPDDDEALTVTVEHIHFPNPRPISVVEEDRAKDGQESSRREIGKAYFGLTEALVSVQKCEPLGNQLVKLERGTQSTLGHAGPTLELDLDARVHETSWRVTPAHIEDPNTEKVLTPKQPKLSGWLTDLKLVDVCKESSRRSFVSISAGYLHLDFELFLDEKRSPTLDEKRITRQKLQEQVLRTRLRDERDADRFIICLGFPK